MQVLTQANRLLHDDSAMEVMKVGALLVGIPVTDGGGPSRPYIARTASVCATHADGSIGRTGSWRGDKHLFGTGSQHFATTSVIGLQTAMTLTHQTVLFCPHGYS